MSSLARLPNIIILREVLSGYYAVCEHRLLGRVHHCNDEFKV